MLEIKFRAWDNVENKMYYVGDEDNIHFYFNGLVLQADKFTNIKIDTGEDYEDDVYCERLYHLIYMQFVGLKDKNGKEIYVGDIVELGTKEVFIVTWHEYKQEFTFKTMKGNYFPETYRGATRNDCYGWLVVGNIYENHELLEEN